MKELDRSDECDTSTAGGGGLHIIRTNTLGQFECYPSQGDKYHLEKISSISNYSGEIPSSFLLPNESLRIKYLEERKKLWKQLTSDFCDSDGGGDDDGDEDGEESQRQIPHVVSLPSGNGNTDDEPEADAEMKDLPEDVTYIREAIIAPAPAPAPWPVPAPAPAPAPTVRHEIMTMQSTAKQAYTYQIGQGQGTSGTFSLRANDSTFAVGTCNPRQPNTYSTPAYLAPRQLTPCSRSCPPSDQGATAKVQLQHPKNASDTFEVVKAQHERRSHSYKDYKDWSQTFDQRFEELKEYKKKHGHCNVPRSQSDLGLWVSKTRQACNKFISLGKKSSPGFYMDEEHMQRFKEIGSGLSMEAAERDMRQTSLFANRLKELKNFRTIYGHIHVPTTGRYKSLGRWCSSVKRSCRDADAGHGHRTSSIRIDSNRFEMLKAIGFDWEPDKRYRTCEERIVELKEFKDLHGHLNVPAKYGKGQGGGASLGYWYRHVKKDYSKTIAVSQSMDMNGNKDSIEIDPVKQKRFEILKEMGLLEGAVDLKEPHVELKAFKDLHGHVNMPYRYGQGLGKWCSHMKRDYSITMAASRFEASHSMETKGKNSDSKIDPVTQKRFEILKEMGLLENVDLKEQPRKRDRICEERIVELKAFQDKNGHLNVPSIFGQSIDTKGKKCSIELDQVKQKRSEISKKIGLLEVVDLKKPQKKRYRTCEERTVELKAFKDLHGHVNVPPGMVKVSASGVSDSKIDPVKQKRFEILKEMGLLEGAVDLKEPQKRRYRTCEERIVELKEFKDLHGHVNVPSRYGQGLGKWCWHVKRDYSKTMAASRFAASHSTNMKGKNSDSKIDPVKQKRFEILIEMGLLDDVDLKEQPMKTYRTYEERIVQLKEFKDQNGHVNVPSRCGQGLGKWCFQVKRDYSKTIAASRFAASHSTNMKGKNSDSKIDPVKQKRFEILKEFEILIEMGLLENVGLKEQPRKRDRMFEERIVELKAFKDQNGHLNVPYRYGRGGNPGLGNWYWRIKRDYSKTMAASRFAASHSTNMKGKNSDSKIDPVKQKRFEILIEMGLLDDVDLKEQPMKTYRTYEERIVQLKEFKDQNGHVNVPSRCGQGLGKWCFQVKRDYSKTIAASRVAASHSTDLKGKKSTIKIDPVKQKRFEILEEMGLL
eukprot:CAMPEP_0194125596 /NCGR_PEP_ID=MMETSP0150-20130528/59544_1 /TAXON_ID=122233 /ORGANISM="Chaetoceros debilis, Strain MM31A-1" /LENGTH=1154 /DNA_ID=CAMNT_0038819409 /DNA_START=216 /DNA_END=3682 /DNA_ORIENTATION=+